MSETRTEGRAATGCSFCGTHQDQAGALIKGRSSVMICEQCVAGAVALIADEARRLHGRSLHLVLDTPGAPPAPEAA